MNLIKYFKNLCTPKPINYHQLLTGHGWNLNGDQYEKMGYKIVIHHENLWYGCPIDKPAPRISGTLESLHDGLFEIEMTFYYPTT